MQISQTTASRQGIERKRSDLGTVSKMALAPIQRRIFDPSEFECQTLIRMQNEIARAWIQTSVP